MVLATKDVGNCYWWGSVPLVFEVDFGEAVGAGACACACACSCAGGYGIAVYVRGGGEGVCGYVPARLVFSSHALRGEPTNTRQSQRDKRIRAVRRSVVTTKFTLWNQAHLSPYRPSFQLRRLLCCLYFPASSFSSPSHHPIGKVEDQDEGGGGKINKAVQGNVS